MDMALQKAKLKRLAGTVAAAAVALAILFLVAGPSGAQERIYPDQIIDLIAPAPVLDGGRLGLDQAVTQDVRDQRGERTNLNISRSIRQYHNDRSVGVLIVLYLYDTPSIGEEQARAAAAAGTAASTRNIARELRLGTFAWMNTGPSTTVPDARGSATIVSYGPWMLQLRVDALASSSLGSDAERDAWVIRTSEQILSGLQARIGGRQPPTGDPGTGDNDPLLVAPDILDDVADFLDDVARNLADPLGDAEPFDPPSPGEVAAVTAAITAALIAAGIAASLAQAIAAAIANALQAGIELTAEEINEAILRALGWAASREEPEPERTAEPPPPPKPPPIIDSRSREPFETNDQGQYWAPDEKGNYRWLDEKEAREAARALGRQTAELQRDREHHYREHERNLDASSRKMRRAGDAERQRIAEEEQRAARDKYAAEAHHDRLLGAIQKRIAEVDDPRRRDALMEEFADLLQNKDTEGAELLWDEIRPEHKGRLQEERAARAAREAADERRAQRAAGWDALDPDAQRRAKLLSAAQKTISELGDDKRQDAYMEELADLLQREDTEGAQLLWDHIRGERQLQIDKTHRQAQWEATKGKVWGAGETTFTVAREGSKALLGAGAAIASGGSSLAGAAVATGGLTAIGGTEGGVRYDASRDEVGFDKWEAAKGAARGAKAGIEASIGGVKTQGRAAVAFGKMFTRSTLEAAETYADTGDAGKAGMAGLLNAAGDLTGEVLDQRNVGGWRQAAAESSANMLESTARGVYVEDKDLVTALGDAATGEAKSRMAAGVMNQAMKSPRYTGISGERTDVTAEPGQVTTPHRIPGAPGTVAETDAPRIAEPQGLRDSMAIGPGHPGARSPAAPSNDQAWKARAESEQLKTQTDLAQARLDAEAARAAVEADPGNAAKKQAAERAHARLANEAQWARLHSGILKDGGLTAGGEGGDRPPRGQEGGNSLHNLWQYGKDEAKTKAIEGGAPPQKATEHVQQSWRARGLGDSESVPDGYGVQEFGDRGYVVDDRVTLGPLPRETTVMRQIDKPRGEPHWGVGDPSSHRVHQAVEGGVDKMPDIQPRGGQDATIREIDVATYTDGQQPMSGVLAVTTRPGLLLERGQQGDMVLEVQMPAGRPIVTSHGEVTRGLENENQILVPEIRGEDIRRVYRVEVDQAGNKRFEVIWERKA